jgi:hypothetical protein
MFPDEPDPPIEPAGAASSEEYETFKRALEKVVSASKTKVDEALERERDERRRRQEKT